MVVNASASAKTPEDDTGAETARVGMDAEPIADVLEHKVIYLENYDHERTIGEAKLDNAVIVGTDSVITVEKAELMNDSVTYGVDGGSDYGDFDKNGDKNNDDRKEDNEAETEEEDWEDNEAATEEEDGEDNEAAIEEEDVVEADEDEDEDEDNEEKEEEEIEEDDDVYKSDDEDEVNENKEEDNEGDVKAVNDEVDQGNKIKEEVEDDKTEKEGVYNLKERLKKKVNAAKDKNVREKLSGGSALSALKSEHKEIQGDRHVTIEKADGEKTKENSGGRSKKQKRNKFIKESRMKTVEGHPKKFASEGVIIGEVDKGKEKEENGRGGGSSKQKSKKSKKKNRTRSADGSSKKVASEREDKPEPGSKRSSVKKVKSMGMIFMCSTKTKDDCYRYKVLGLPASKRESVEKIYKGMRLFLYDVDLKLLYGIYKAAGPGGFNIQPKAFNSQFPSQVRFTILEDCLPLGEEKFKRVIRENYYTKKKFETLLTSKQVKDLCKLFLAAGKPGKGHGSKKIGRKRKAPISTDRDRSRYRNEDFPAVLNDRRRHQERSPYRERAVVLPPVRPASRFPLPPPAAAALPYDRALVVDDYRREPRVEHRGSYRQDAYVQQLDPYRLPEVERLDARRDAYRIQPRLDPVDPYRRDVVVQRHDLRSLYDYRRPESTISYRGIADSVDSVRRLDPYDSHREHAAYLNPVYSTDVLPERDDYATVRRLTTSSLPEYRSVRTRYHY